MVCVTNVSVRVMAHMEGLHSIEQSLVVASDGLILVLGTPPGVAKCGL